MSSRIAPVFVAGALVVLGVAPASAQELSPSNEAIDQDLDQALEREYEHSDDHPPPPPAESGVVVATEQDDDDGRGGIRLRLAASYWRAYLRDITLSDGVGDAIDELEIYDFDDFKYAGDPDDDPDGQGVVAGHYELSLDFNRVVGLRGAFTHARWRGDAVVGTDDVPDGFSYGSTTWGSGDELDVTIELYTADFDLVLRPLNTRYINFDLTLGARYVSWKTELARGGITEMTHLESVVPTAGVALGVRPVSWFELFGRARVGHLSYEYDDDDGEEVRESRDTTTLELECGVQVTIFDTVGIMLGYRVEHTEIERFDGDGEQRAEGTAQGVFAGLTLQF
jgi:opacity protein-like surface antigen